VLDGVELGVFDGVELGVFEGATPTTKIVIGEPGASVVPTPGLVWYTVPTGPLPFPVCVVTT
jgi:hypothetical protein